MWRSQSRRVSHACFCKDSLVKLTAKAIRAVRFPGCSSKHLQVKERKVNTVLNHPGRHPDTGGNTTKTEHTMPAVRSLWHYALDKELCSAAALPQHSLPEGTDCQKLLFIFCLGGSQILPGLEKTKMHKVRLLHIQRKRPPDKPQTQRLNPPYYPTHF